LRYETALALAEDLQRFPARRADSGPASEFVRAVLALGSAPTGGRELGGLAVLLALGGALGITFAWLHALAGWNEADHLRVRPSETDGGG